MFPYLKGIHLTLYSWREGRREDGWKRSRKEMELPRTNSDTLDEVEGLEEGGPSFVEHVPRYEAGVMALKAITDPQFPPKRHVQSKVFITVANGFTDASGKGFGSTITINGILLWRSGQWKKFYEDESLNRRKFENIVITLE
jgi:hypothetical protein